MVTQCIQYSKRTGEHNKNHAEQFPINKYTYVQHIMRDINTARDIKGLSEWQIIIKLKFEKCPKAVIKDGDLPKRSRTVQIIKYDIFVKKKSDDLSANILIMQIMNHSRFLELPFGH